jgi:exosortase
VEGRVVPQSFSLDQSNWSRWLPYLLGGLAFLSLFWLPLTTLPRDWWQEPDAGHGLLLTPVAIYLAWKRGLVRSPRAQPALGIGMLVVAVLLRYFGQMAAEPYTTRIALLGALAALTVYRFGSGQLLHWWLPAALLLLAIPLPAVVLASLALPLQLKASQIGAGLLEWRYVPVRLAGNVVYVPGHALFVTEACSGLRSLASLLSLGLLVGALSLASALSRVVLLAVTVPVAILLNGVRVFLTGFLVYHVDPRFGEGFMHATEGWLIFVLALVILGGTAAALGRVERLVARSR